MSPARLFVIILSFVFFQKATGQECEWLSTSHSDYGEVAYSVAADDSNNVIACGVFAKEISVDTITVIRNNPPGSASGCIIKYRPDGIVKWIYAPTRLSTNMGLGSTQFTNLATDDSCNIYTLFAMVGYVDFGNGVIINDSINPSYIILKINANGITQWAKRIPLITTFAPITVDNQNNLIIAGETSSSSLALYKYSPLGNLIKSDSFGVAQPYELATDADDNVYIACYNPGVFAFGSQTITTKQGYVLLKVDSAFNPLVGRSFKHNLPYYAPGSLFYAPHFDVNKNGFCAVTGMFKDTMDFGGTFLIGLAQKNAFIAYYDSTLNLKWVKKDNSSSVAEVWPLKVVINNNNIYFGGFLTKGSSSFDAFPLNYSGNNTDLFFIKADTLANILWAFTSASSGGAVLQDISTDSLGNVLVTGWYGVFSTSSNNTITVFDVTKQGSPTNQGDLFVAKIANYSITRGYVYPGPYCAGDTIKIPFTKVGKYDPGNEFIAQLSDSSSNFEGGERELGRITDTTGGIIKGLLPPFDVASSNKYRIRIISTKPQVQSFYWKDSLRLLIFSKDTANAGNDTVLCKGNPVTLGVTGGSKWNWWPAKGFTNPADTANRRPTVVPDTTVEYRIIISDSSGCGVTDTDYVKIHVKPALKIITDDKIKLCLGRSITLKVKGEGGDSVNYKYTWLKIPENSVVSTKDELFIKPFSTARYWAKLKDGCTVKNDSVLVLATVESGLTLIKSKDTTICLGHQALLTAKALTCDTTAVKYVWDNNLGNGAVKTVAPSISTTYKIMAYDTINGSRDSAFIKVNVLPKLQLLINPDTTLCNGASIQLEAKAAGGLPTGYRVKWNEINGVWADTNFTTTVIPAKTTTYLAVLTDNCSVAADTQKVVVKVRPALAVEVNKDTSICTGESVVLSAIPQGGLDPQYKILWKDGSGWTDTNFSVTINPAKSTAYTAVLSDNCTLANDSATVLITLRTPLSLQVSPDTVICHNGTATLNALPSGGYAPNYKIVWTNDNSPWTDTNYTITQSPASNTAYTAILTDNCTARPDTQYVKVKVLLPLSLQITGPDTLCQGRTLLLTAAVTGGDSLKWKLSWTADTKPLTASKNPLVDTPSVTTTYTATLIDGCSPPALQNYVVAVLPVPKAAFSIADTVGCVPLLVSLSDNSLYHDSLLNKWDIPVTGVLNTPTPQPQAYYNSGFYRFSLSVSNSLGCRDSVSRYQKITVHPLPKAGFIVKPDIKESGKELQLINTTRGGISAEWITGDGNTFFVNGIRDTLYNYKDSGNYTISLVAITEHGCADTFSQTIRVFDPLYCIVPNAFTPNGDGINNTFAPVCSGLASYTLTIFNRWGEVILNCENCRWDGTHYGQPVTGGIYMYLLKIHAQSHLEETVYGTVNVLR